MKIHSKWWCSLVVAIGCAFGAPASAEESLADSYQNQPVFRPPLIRQTAAQVSTSPATADPAAPQQVPTSRWDIQEPVQTPEQEGLTVATTGNCASCEIGCGPRLQFIAGVEATFFFPQISRTFLQTGFTNGLGSVNIVNNAALGSTDGSLFIGPRMFVGVQGECWGLVGRYWNSNSSANGFIPAIPDATQSGVLLFDRFQAYTADIEVQRRFCWRNWDMFGFLGARYASVNNDRNLWIQNSFGTDLVTASAFAGQQFSGAGLTFGVFGLRPLFCDDGALKAYFTNRYSILWGNGLATVQTNARAEDTVGGGSGENTSGALASGDGSLFIVELGAGLQWDACLRCLPGRAFLRAGFEWQYWDSNAGVFAASQSTGDSGTASAYGTTSAGDLLFDLVGLTFGAGIMY